jgi:hypothetical protein
MSEPGCQLHYYLLWDYQQLDCLTLMACGWVLDCTFLLLLGSTGCSLVVDGYLLQV